MSRKVCIVVTARPSYARIKTVIDAVQQHADLELQLVVAASALLERYGSAVDVIRRDGFEPDALVYMGYGMLAAKGLLRASLDELGWDPPRIMGTAFMFYLMGFDKFEGWVGVDQLDPSNPLTASFHERFVAKYGEDPPMWPNAIPLLAYDTARVLGWIAKTPKGGFRGVESF